MEFWEENTVMTPGLNLLFQERYLVAEVILLAEEAGHATIVILKGTNWGTFGQHPCSVESAFLQDLFEAFHLTSPCCHFL